MPALETAVRNQLLLHQLLAGLPSSISMQIRASGETSDLDKVMERVCLLLTVENRQPQHTTAMVPLEQTNELSALREQMALFTDQVAALTVKQTPQKPVIRCFIVTNLGTFSVNVQCTGLRYTHPVAALIVVKLAILKEIAGKLTWETTTGRPVRPPGVPYLRPPQYCNSCSSEIQ